MFVTFFHALKRAGLPVSLKEYLTLLEGLEAGVTCLLYTSDAADE